MLNLQSEMDISSVHSDFSLKLTLLNVHTTFTTTYTKMFLTSVDLKKPTAMTGDYWDLFAPSSNGSPSQ